MKHVALLLLVVATTTDAQASGKFWWLGRGDDAVLPSTIPHLAAAAEAGTSLKTLSGQEPDCTCVDYYLCDSVGYIISTGEGLVDVRAGALTGPPCDGIQMCCKPPRNDKPPATTTTTTEPPPGDCGVRGGDVFTNLVDVRILNSGERKGGTEFAEFPWTLVLLRSDVPSSSSNPEKNMFVCGASLLHPQVAMTAAHCVSRKRVQELSIRAGEWDTQGKSEPLPHQDRKVASILVHPGFYEGTLYNDVALLYLETPLQLARNVRPICLPRQGDVLDPGSRCIATGWGRNAFGPNGTYQMTMKMVDLPVVSHSKCQDKLRDTRLSSYFNLHESFVCAGGEKDKDTCQGDGGGPLVCRSPRDSDRYIQLGITSWGIGCGDSDIPAVYANVPAFADWVAAQLASLTSKGD